MKSSKSKEASRELVGKEDRAPLSGLNDERRYEKIEPTLRQILICAREHRHESVHLDAIAKILEEWLK